MDKRIGFYQCLAGVGTGLVVTIISGLALWQKPLLVEAMLWQGIVLALIAALTIPSLEQKQPTLSYLSLYALLPTVFALSVRVPVDVFFIYTIIWMACAPYYLSRKWCWWWLLAINVGWYFVRWLSWGDTQPLFGTLLVATFHVFALLSAMAAQAAEQANEKTQKLNRELLATQHLLSEASRESERTRIARDLHDLLGHHLTALTINLQVAGHISDGEAKEKIDQCHALSKLLLADVRDAVATLRDLPMVNLRELLEITVRDIPRLEIQLDIEESLDIDDVHTAETLLRLVQEAITNTLKHSSAGAVTIRVFEQHDQIVLEYSDNGNGCDQLIPGHGLTGMRERLERLGGTLLIEPKPGFKLRALTPIAN